jgi:phage portal protein BeeE
MRPDGQLGWQRVGYVYFEGGKSSGAAPVPLMLDEVSHFAPHPDPLASFRGMSWLTPVAREVEADQMMTKHKRRFLENGATPNMIITHAKGADRDAILAFDERMKAQNAGVANAGKTLNLYPGADATIVGSNMKELDFKAVQGAGETRIAAAAGVPPVIVGLSEGLEAATYSNYALARRRFADGTMHPTWASAAGALGTIMPSQGGGTRLWYDADDIPFLREDEKDAAEIDKVRAETVSSLVNAGYTPDSVIATVESGDFRLLVHTGLYSVQLQKPGEGMSAADARAVTQALNDARQALEALHNREVTS